MYWHPFNMYSENFGFGPGGFIIRETFTARGKGLVGFCYEASHKRDPEFIETAKLLDSFD